MKTLVVALGGNALLQRGEALTAENQYRNIASAVPALARLAQRLDAPVVPADEPAPPLSLPARVLTVGELEFNLDTLEVRREGKLIQLNPTALKILQALMEASPAVVTRQDLESRVWGEELPDSDSLRVHIHGLRALLDKPFAQPMIQTRHGIGYRITAPGGD